MDLSSLAVSGTSKLTLKHPATKEPLDIAIELCGKDSDVYRKQYAELVKSLSVSLKGGADIDYAKLDIETYVACTIDWENVELEGKELECTPDNVRAIYSNQDYRWIHEQVIEFVGNRENFM